MDTNPIVIGTLKEGLKWVGRQSGEFVGPDVVERGSIRHFCELVEDPNPLYYDDVYAKRTIWDSVIAPPGSLAVWCNPAIWSASGKQQTETPRMQRQVPLPGDVLIGTSVDTDYYLPIRLGDRLSYSERISRIEPKTTRLGEGCFIDLEKTYRRQDGQVTAIQRHTVFRYQAHKASVERLRTEKVAELPADPKTAKDDLPTIAMTLEYWRCVLCASATRDYNPIHHDRDFARRNNAPDVFISMIMYQGLFSRLLLNWAGPNASLKRLAFNMKGMNIPGDTMTIGGTVESVSVQNTTRLVHCSVRVTNQRVGLTTTGTALIEMPRQS